MSRIVFQKEELIDMLQEIQDDLEDLETVLETNSIKLRKKWYEEQSIKIRKCGKRMDLLEMQIVQSAKISEEAVTHFTKMTAPLKFELGY